MANEETLADNKQPVYNNSTLNAHVFCSFRSILHLKNTETLHVQASRLCF